MGELLYADAIHIRNQSKIDAARITEASGNQKQAAETALQQFSSSLSNQRAMDAAGKQVNADTTNIAHNLDATTSGTFEGRVAAAEQLGASVSQQAAAGIGGSTVEAYNHTIELSQAMREEAQERASNSDLVNASQARGQTIQDATAGLDNNVYRANLDYTQYVDDHEMGLFERLGFTAAAGAATAFGGPQAGMAVLGVAQAKQQAMNGDFAGASQSAMGAIQNGLSAYRDTRKLGGNYWSGGKWASTAQAQGGSQGYSSINIAPPSTPVFTSFRLQ